MSEERTRFRAWITKYALTSGIKETEVEDCFDTDPEMVQDLKGGPHAYYHRNDWHRTRAAAMVRAREMRDAKIISLHKQITKLKAMTFAGEKP